MEKKDLALILKTLGTLMAFSIDIVASTEGKGSTVKMMNSQLKQIGDRIDELETPKEDWRNN